MFWVKVCNGDFKKKLKMKIFFLLRAFIDLFYMVAKAPLDILFKSEEMKFLWFFKFQIKLRQNVT